MATDRLSLYGEALTIITYVWGVSSVCLNVFVNTAFQVLATVLGPLHSCPPPSCRWGKEAERFAALSDVAGLWLWRRLLVLGLWHQGARLTPPLGLVLSVTWSEWWLQNYLHALISAIPDALARESVEYSKQYLLWEQLCDPGQGRGARCLVEHIFSVAACFEITSRALLSVKNNCLFQTVEVPWET